MRISKKERKVQSIKGALVLMSSENPIKKSNKPKILVSVFLFFVLLVVAFFGIVTANQYKNFNKYRTLATELNQVLGGGYKTTYTWQCDLESTNCPSVRMIKDTNFKDNDEAKAVIESYRSLLISEGFTEVKRGICEADKYFKVYCSLDAKKNNLAVTFNAKQDFIGIDINP